MHSKENICKYCMETNRNRMNRRTFFANSVGRTAGLSLLALPGIHAGILTAQEIKSKDEVFAGLDAKADRFMKMYGSCAMSSFAALNEQFRLNEDRMVAAMRPFTGGVAGKGETCGAVSGSMLALGILFESMDQGKKKQAGSSMKLGGLFYDRFEKEFGSTRCREVVKHQYGRYFDFNSPDGLKEFMAASREKGDRCLDVVKAATHMVTEIFMQYGPV